MARQASSTLQKISPDRIKPNPDNPRLIFLEEEMNELLASIEEGGIRVPVSLYADGAHFVLLDGERRWRCAKRLNLREIPAVVQPKPTRLENLLMMFNIHNVRVDWDLMPMAFKLGEIRDMLSGVGQDAGPRALAAITGVRLPTVRRALELLDLPVKYQRLLINEGNKPRSERRIKADLFIEIYKSFNAIERYNAELAAKIGKRRYIDAMVRKYLEGVIDNVVAFRDVSKIARASLAGGDQEAARLALLRLVKDFSYSTSDAFRDTVESAYLQRDIGTRARSLAEKLHGVSGRRRLSAEAKSALVKLRSEIDRLLGRA